MPLIRPRIVRSDKPGSGRIMVAASEQDSRVELILKSIPVEVIPFFKIVDSLADSDNYHRGVAIAGVLVTALWIAFATRPDDKPIAWRQVILSSFAFVCWAIGMQPKILAVAWDPTKIGAAVLAVGTVVLPILDGILKRAGIRQN